MEMKLYTVGQPKGRSLMLGNAIQRLTRLGGNESMLIAHRIFDGQITEGKPLYLSVTNISVAPDFEQLCHHSNIIVTRIE